jgi:hypothetical protein
MALLGSERAPGQVAVAVQEIRLLQVTAETAAFRLVVAQVVEPFPAAAQPVQAAMAHAVKSGSSAMRAIRLAVVLSAIR